MIVQHLVRLNDTTLCGAAQSNPDVYFCVDTYVQDKQGALTISALLGYVESYRSKGVQECLACYAALEKQWYMILLAEISL